MHFANRMQIAWTFGAKAFVVQAVAIRVALVALSTVGIGAVIAGIGLAISKLTSTTEEATGALDKFKDVEDEGRRKSAEVQVELDNERKKLRALIEAKQDTTAAISDLNTKYGDIFGKHKTAAEWYDTLTRKSKAYAMQLGYEAQMKMLATQIAEKQIALDENNQKRAELWRQGKAQEIVKSGGQVSMDGSVHGGVAKTVDTKEYTELKDTGRTLVADINALNGKLKIAETRVASFAKEVGTPERTGIHQTTPNTGNLRNTGSSGSSRKLDNSRKASPALRAAGEAARDSYAAITSAPVVSPGVQPMAYEPPTAPKTIAEYDEAIRFYTERQQNEDADQIIKTQGIIDELTKGRDTLDLSVNIPSMIEEVAKIDSLPMEDYKLKIEDMGVDAVTSKLEYLRELLSDMDHPLGDKQRDSLKMLQGHYKRYASDLKKADKEKKKLEKTDAAAASIGQIGSALSGLGDSIELPELNIAGTLAQAIATMVAGYATATTQAASLGPWAWIAFAATGLAQLTAMISSVKGVAKFADGGIVSGPTYALVGEYAGARNNPEVIAPLDKLRSMINPAGSVVGGKFEMEVRGRKLYAVLQNENKLSGRKYDI